MTNVTDLTARMRELGTRLRSHGCDPKLYAEYKKVRKEWEVATGVWEPAVLDEGDGPRTDYSSGNSESEGGV